MQKPNHKNEKFAKILAALDSEFVTPEDFRAAFNSVLDILEVWKKNQSGVISKLETNHQSALADLNNRFNDINETVKAKLASLKDGKTPTKEELTSLVKTLIPAFPKLPEILTREDVVNIVTPLIPKEKDESPVELTIESIDGLRDELDTLKKKIKVKASNSNSGVAGRNLFTDIDISSQFDGIKSTFNIPAVWNIINVSLSSYPYGSLRKNIDYTYTTTTITFTSQINPATQLSAGQACVLSVVIG